MMNSGLCSIPPLGGIEIELHRLYVEVTARGGLEKVPPYLHSVTGRLVLLNLSQNYPFIFSGALGVSTGGFSLKFTYPKGILHA